MYAIVAVGLMLAILILHAIYGGHVKFESGGGHGGDTSDLGAFAGFCALFAAFSGGLAFALFNDGHLEFAWTQPVGRERLALSLVVVDALAIAVDFAIVYVVTLCTVLALARNVSALGASWPSLLGGLAFVAFPLSWYGLILALTESVRNRGSYTGISIFAGIASVALVLLGATRRMPPEYHRLFEVINVVNPLAYVIEHGGKAGPHVDVAGLPYGSPLELLAWCALAVAGVAAAMVQWRRIEA